MTEQAVSCNGLTFPVTSWGNTAARPVLLLHGFPQQPATWAGVAEPLAGRGFQFFAPYQRGYLPCTRPSGFPRYAFTEFVDDALGIADALDLERFDVIGFGMGGMQAWMLAALHPERVRSLISLRYPHPAAFARGILSEPEQQAKWNALQQRFGSADLRERADAMLANDAIRLRTFLRDVALPQPFYDRYLEQLLDPETLMGAFAWERAISLEQFAQTPAVTAPTLLLWSEGPGLAPETVAATRQYAKGYYREALIPDVGNFMLETAPGALLEPIYEHLSAH